MIPALIALDWGTSSLRAWLLDAGGRVLDSRAEPWGIMHLPPGGFPAAFAAVTRDWPAASMPSLACGMVGSRQGWVEAPYLPTPAPLGSLAAHLAPVPPGHGGPAGPDGAALLRIVPGLLESSEPDAPDVMRGEETQAIGALPLLGGDGVLIMPGTHSKWARLSDGRLDRFCTLMTGELFALLRGHSILGRLVPADAPEPRAAEAAFALGAGAGFQHGALARLFAARALTLTGRLDASCVPDYLSGLLIGEEIRLGLARMQATRLAITGDAALCARYLRAFAACGLPGPQPVADTALAGLRLIAAHAGLLSHPSAVQEGQ